MPDGLNRERLPEADEPSELGGSCWGGWVRVCEAEVRSEW
jgi:hypothetical protein